MATTSVSRNRLRTRQVQEKHKRNRLILAGAGILVLGALLLLFRPWAGAGAFPEYGPEDVARYEPIIAQHEMGAGPPIPFLPSTGPQPELVKNEDFVHLGSVGPTEVVRLEFALANTGQAPLTISRAFTTCGCTTAEISSAVIPPGMVSEVTLIFDAGYHDTRGQAVRRGLILESNDPRRSVQEIWLQASVRNE